MTHGFSDFMPNAMAMHGSAFGSGGTIDVQANAHPHLQMRAHANGAAASGQSLGAEAGGLRSGFDSVKPEQQTTDEWQPGRRRCSNHAEAMEEDSDTTHSDRAAGTSSAAAGAAPAPEEGTRRRSRRKAAAGSAQLAEPQQPQAAQDTPSPRWANNAAMQHMFKDVSGMAPAGRRTSSPVPSGAALQRPTRTRTAFVAGRAAASAARGPFG